MPRGKADSTRCEGSGKIELVNLTARSQVQRPLNPLSPRFIPAARGVVIALFLAAVFLPHFHRDTGLSSLIRFGEIRRQFLPPEMAGVPMYLIPNRYGFDGQFYAHMAVHPPFLYHDLSDHYDFPAYRLRRIFLPGLAWALGLGHPFWIVQIYSCFNFVAWLALAWLLAACFPSRDWTDFGRWTGCLVSAGVLESVRGSLTDLPSLVMMFAGMRLWENRRRGAGVGCFAAGVLTRETLALSVFGLLWPHPVRTRGLLRLAIVGGVVVLPTALWTLYVIHYFPTDSRGVEGNFNWPFRGVVGTAIDAWAHLRSGVEDNGRYTFRLVTMVSFPIQVGVVLTGWRQRPEWLRIALPFILLFPFLGLPVWEGPWGLWRGILPVTIAFCFLVPAGRWFWPLLVVGSLPSLHAMFRLVF